MGEKCRAIGGSTHTVRMAGRDVTAQAEEFEEKNKDESKDANESESKHGNCAVKRKNLSARRTWKRAET